MKVNHMSDTTKICVLVATVIIVLVICSVGFKMVNDGKSSVNTNTNKFTEMTGQYQDMDISLYEGSLTPGSELCNIIKKAVDNKHYLSIEVYTLDGSTTSYNYIFNTEDKLLSEIGQQGQEPKTSTPVLKSEFGYINQSAVFLGSTHKDANGNIVCIRFEQQP